jgi:signal transduction histidine kinase
MRTLQERTRSAFIWLFIIPVAFCILTFWSAARFRSSLFWVSHTEEVIAAGHDVLFTLTKAESSQRGFLLTGDKSFYRKYVGYRDQMPGKLSHLRELTVDNPRQQHNIAQLSSAVQARLQTLEHVIAPRSDAHLPEVQAPANVQTGAALMARIEGIASAITAEENRLLNERTRLEHRTETELIVLFSIGIALTVMLLFGSYRLIEQYAEQRDRAEADIRNLNADLESRVQARTAELEQTNLLLSRSNRDLTHFAYVASHDLQEPLRTIGSYAGLLGRKYKGELDEQADKYIDFVVTGAKRMQTLVQDLLAYSRAGTGVLRRESVEIEAVLDRAKENLTITTAERGAKITNGPLPQLEVDPGMLTQVFQNLIGNALKFSKPGETPQVSITASRQQREWIFEVSDNGIGFEPEYAEKVFVIFQRLHSVGAYTGTGIGLAICKRIIEAHGGRIWAESQPGMGSNFFFALPVSARTGAPAENTLLVDT